MNKDSCFGLIDVLSIEQIERDFFRGAGTPGGKGRSYGGHVLGQALMAATRTVDISRPVHSLHAYFMRPGEAAKSVLYRVDRDRDGKSFSTRRVIAVQNGEPILNLSASFHRAEDGYLHQARMPDVPPPEDLIAEEILAERVGNQLPNAYIERMREKKFLEMRPVRPGPPLIRDKQSPEQNIWLRVRDPIGDDPNVHRAALAYLSDYGVLGTAMLPYGWAYGDPEMQFASLDHSLWFHNDMRADLWLLYSMEGPWAGGARGFSQGKLFTRDGRQIATVCQEGLTRRLRAY